MLQIVQKKEKSAEYRELVCFLQHSGNLTVCPPQYIYGYPWHLDDSWATRSRPISWLEEGFITLRGGGLWVDDMYMGTALTAAWAKILGDHKQDPIMS